MLFTHYSSQSKLTKVVGLYIDLDLGHVDPEDRPHDGTGHEEGGQGHLGGVLDLVDLLLILIVQFISRFRVGLG